MRKKKYKTLKLKSVNIILISVPYLKKKKERFSLNSPNDGEMSVNLKVDSRILVT